MKLNYAIVFVSDMDRSVKYYRDLFGLPLKFETPEWTEFSTGEATLALHKGGSARRSEGESDAIASGQCRPGLQVGDLDELHSRLIGNGVTCVQPPMNSFGARIAQYLDPDGLIVSVGESKG
jgi:lactoylglutathione lyase